MSTSTAVELVESQELQVMDKAARPSGINVGGNTVVQATAHLKADEQTLIRGVHSLARQMNWDWDSLARETKISTTTWYRIFTDKYRYPEFETEGENKKPHPHARERIPLDGICERIRRWYRVWQERAFMPDEEFIETSVWKRVDWLCRRAFLRKRMGFIYGESQIGKTSCLMEYQRRNNSGQTTYMEIPPSGGVQMMVKAVAKALNVSTNTSYENLLDDVIDALDDSRLLIVDEIHRVFTTYQKTSIVRCLDVLRFIQNKTRCGMVLCGTEVFRDELKRGDFFRFLKQLDKRGLYQLQLPSVPPREDLDLIARHYGLAPASGRAEELMEAIAHSDGFGRYCMRLLDAAELAANKKRKVSWEDFLEANRIADALSLGVEGKR